MPDFSQVYQLLFTDLVSLDEIMSELKKQDFIEYVDPPMEAYTCLTANDTHFANGNQWSMARVNAEDTWDITTGSSAITISINDVYSHPDFAAMPRLHDDIASRVVHHNNLFGYHGNFKVVENPETVREL